MAPEIRAILLELDGEAEIQIWPVTSEEEVWGRGCPQWRVAQMRR